MLYDDESGMSYDPADPTQMRPRRFALKELFEPRDFYIGKSNKSWLHIKILGKISTMLQRVTFAWDMWEFWDDRRGYFPEILITFGRDEDGEIYMLASIHERGTITTETNI